MADNTYSHYFERMSVFENYEKDISCKEYAVARLDGRNFSNFTRDCNKPFDFALVQTMQYATEQLCIEWNADAAYTQSDEISLIWYPKEKETSLFPFNGKLRKLNSLLASSLTGYFNSIYSKQSMNWYDRYTTKIANFDCRIFNYRPLDSTLKLEPLIIRQVDCVRNSVQQFAQSIFSHNKLQNKSIKEIKEMLREKHDPWEDIHDVYKFGTYFFRELKEMEIEDYYKIPVNHRPEKIPLRTYYRKSNQNLISLLKHIKENSNEVASDIVYSS